MDIMDRAAIIIGVFGGSWILIEHSPFAGTNFSAPIMNGVLLLVGAVQVFRALVSDRKAQAKEPNDD